MKTTLFNLYQQCENLSFFSSLRRWLSAFSWSSLKRLRPVAPVILAIRAGHLARTIKANNRLLIGLWVMLVVAPLSGVAYQLFDSSAPEVIGWYYYNNYYFVFSLCPYITQTVLMTGFFLITPLSKRSWLVSLPMAYPAAKILWLCTATSNEEFNQLIPGFFSLVGLLTSIVWLFLFNWILERKFHRFDALIARAFGILLSKGMTNDEKVKLATPLLKQIKEFN